MKKILVVLFGLFIFQNAYSDSILDTDIKSDIVDFAHGNLNDDAIRALCKKVLDYASEHNFNIQLKSDNNNFYTPRSSDCENSNIKFVSNILMGTSIQLAEKTSGKDSQCTYEHRQIMAKSLCDGEMSSFVINLEFDYMFDFDNAVLQCSETDDRCVNNLPAYNNDGRPIGYLSTCCKVSLDECEDISVDNSDIDNMKGSVVVKNRKKWLANPRTLNDFDDDCNPVNK